ncbi:MAG TPA: hypothetical protein VKC66_18135 [Xanthobacteraceae bacterium]|nr:hypothetical protein [Xanthobacteraceae bacterium]
MRLLSGLIEVVRVRFGAWRQQGTHMDRIIAEAKKAVEARYGVADARVERVFRDPPPAMRGLARPGPAWFLRFAKPHAKGVLFVEIDDATERVTRIWGTPR